MLRIPVGIIGAFIFILGLHGVYIYSNRLAGFLGMFGLGGFDNSKLFYTFTLPPDLSSGIAWMSMKGTQSIFIPLLFIGIGVWLWVISGLHRKSIRLTRKLRLW